MVDVTRVDSTFKSLARITNHSFERSLSYSSDFLHLEAFDCNTTSYWLNHTVYPISSCVKFHFANLGEKDKECC